MPIIYNIKFLKLIILFIFSCGSNEKIYPAFGVIHEVFHKTQKMTIHHDEIPGFMMAMTMTLQVDNSINMNEWFRGDSISFEIIINKNNGYIRSIKHIDTVIIPKQEEAFWQDDDEPTRIGGILPNSTFLDLDSNEVSLSQNNGKYRFISFVFSRCPMPNMCPALMMKYRYLATELTMIKNLEFITISFDYIYDNPFTLKQHYEGIIKPFPNWNIWSSFGHAEDIISLAHFSQFAFWGIENNDIGHSMRSLLLSPNCELLQAWDGTDWKAVNVKNEISNILQLYK